MPIPQSPHKLGPNADLIGRENSRHGLSTPCLVLDLESLEHNISSMAKLCKDAQIAIRPHAKTHKSLSIAKRQLDAGAVGISVATIGEAGIFSAGGIKNILITSPLPPGPKMNRLIALIKDGGEVICVVDDLGCVAHLSGLAEQAGIMIPVFVDIDTGRHRTGTVSPADTVQIAQQVNHASHLRLEGLQSYAGHLSHTNNFAERTAGSNDMVKLIDQTRSALDSQGITIPIVSGGSTGTSQIDPGLAVLTEMQCGSYVFMDVEYRQVDLDGQHGTPFQPALFVCTTVISKNQPSQATTDAGCKHFISRHDTDPQIWPNDGTLSFQPQSDEHGNISVISGPDKLKVGDTFDCLIPHCDPTANLFDHYHVVRGDTLVDIWPIDARGVF